MLPDWLTTALYYVPFLIIGVVGLVLSFGLRTNRGMVIAAMALLIAQQVLGGLMPLLAYLDLMPFGAIDIGMPLSAVMFASLGVPVWVLIFMALLRRERPSAGPGHGYVAQQGPHPRQPAGPPQPHPAQQSPTHGQDSGQQPWQHGWGPGAPQQQPPPAGPAPGGYGQDPPPQGPSSPPPPGR